VEDWDQSMTKEELLGEIEDLIRSMPPRPTIRHDTPENIAWLGRLAAAIELWDSMKGPKFDGLMRVFHGPLASEAGQAFRQVTILLHQARNDLRMKTRGPLSVAVDAGAQFDYFDNIRQIIQTATGDLLFVDPYLDAEFVSRYLPHVADGVAVRLLAREKLATLLPAVTAFRAQHKTDVEVRSSPGFHDRYLFIDRSSGYQSGASFKDGAKMAPTTVIQVTDAFQATLETYEKLWQSAKTHPLNA
jgi:hypothetical protein